jgi:pimeloyl-ACP methyl ester carboxylesterase
MPDILTPGLSSATKDDTLVVMNTASLKEVDLPEGHLAYLDAGAGPPVVLLHGGGLDHRMWDDQVAALAGEFRVLAVDARGHGWSTTPTRPFRHCDDLAVLLQRLELGPATLVGLSMGASTALDTAAEHPDLVRAVVVVGAGHGNPTFTDPFVLGIFAELQRAAEAQDPDVWLEAYLRFGAGPHRTLADVDPRVTARSREMLQHTLHEHIGTTEPVLPTPAADTAQRLPTLAAPVLAIIGDLDSPDHNRMAGDVARTVPNGRLATVAGTAHYPNMERPAEFDAILLEFLRDHAR